MSLGKRKSSGAGKGNKDNNKIPKNWFRVLWFFLLCSMLVIAVINIKPYVDAAQRLGVTIVDAAFIKLISVIPGCGQNPLVVAMAFMLIPNF